MPEEIVKVSHVSPLPELWYPGARAPGLHVLEAPIFPVLAGR